MHRVFDILIPAFILACAVTAILWQCYVSTVVCFVPFSVTYKLLGKHLNILFSTSTRPDSGRTEYRRVQCLLTRRSVKRPKLSPAPLNSTSLLLVYMIVRADQLSV